MSDDPRLFFFQTLAIATGGATVAAFAFEWFGQARPGVLMALVILGIALQVIFGVFAWTAWQERGRDDG